MSNIADYVGKRIGNFSNAAYSWAGFTTGTYQCVTYVRGRLKEKKGKEYLGGFSYAKQMIDVSKKRGIATGTEPYNDCFAVYGNGTYGHVIYVEEVVSDTVYYSQANLTGDSKLSADDGVVSKTTVAGLKKLFGNYLGCAYVCGKTRTTTTTTAKATTSKTAIGTILVVNDTYKVTASSLNIRSGAGTNYGVVGSAAKGKSYKLIEFLKVGNTIWGKISTQHWICVSASGTFYVNVTGTTTAALNYRSGAGTGYKILGTFKSGTKLTFTKTSGSWAYASGKGWVSLHYIK